MLEDRNIEVKHLLEKQNESIRNLIINKTHLIEDSAMPVITHPYGAAITP
jgi:hypothetical protein